MKRTTTLTCLLLTLACTSSSVNAFTAPSQKTATSSVVSKTAVFDQMDDWDRYSRSPRGGPRQQEMYRPPRRDERFMDNGYRARYSDRQPRLVNRNQPPPMNMPMERFRDGNYNNNQFRPYQRYNNNRYGNPNDYYDRPRPKLNNMLIAWSADLLVQIGNGSFDIQRSFFFGLFGYIFLGGIQYLYQNEVYRNVFDVESYAEQPLEYKWYDSQGRAELFSQTILDLALLTAIYLPTFYIFRACVYGEPFNPAMWFDKGLAQYVKNFGKDEAALLAFWVPANLISFSISSYNPLPIRPFLTFLWIAYLSYQHGPH